MLIQIDGTLQDVRPAREDHIFVLRDADVDEVRGIKLADAFKDSHRHSIGVVVSVAVGGNSRVRLGDRVGFGAHAGRSLSFGHEMKLGDDDVKERLLCVHQDELVAFIDEPAPAA